MKNNYMPLVTAVITTYKRKPEIVKRALESIIRQTYKNIEIYIVNDYPSDAELVEELKQMILSYSEDRMINYLVVEKNGGACRARNLALKYAKGKYFACLDDDDEWMPNKIQLQVDSMESSPTSAISYCNAIIRYDEKDKEKIRFSKKQPEGDIYFALISKNLIGSCTFPMFKTDVLKSLGGFNVEMPALQDWELYLRITKEYEAIYIHSPLAKYYFYKGERISVNKKNRVVAYEKIHDLINNDLIKRKKSTSNFYRQGAYFYSIASDIKNTFRYYCLAVKNDPLSIKCNTKDLLRFSVRIFIKPSYV